MTGTGKPAPRQPRIPAQAPTAPNPAPPRRPPQVVMLKREEIPAIKNQETSAPEPGAAAKPGR